MSFVRCRPAPSAVRRPLHALLALLVVAAAGCGGGGPDAAADRLAKRYVLLAMDLDRYRPGEIDQYFGPDALDRRDRGGDVDIDDLGRRVSALGDAIPAPGERDTRLSELATRISQLSAVIDFLAAESEDAERVRFAEETERLYAVAWREPDPARLETLRDGVDAVLPGRGSVRIRLADMRRRLIIPAQKRREVFERALEECRRRTVAHWPLENDGGIDIVWTRDVDAAWHSYDGEGRSTLRINELALATVDEVLDVACHEGYPGHHAQFLLSEAADGDDAPPLEKRVELLRSPASALREGAAMYGVDLVFPPAERIAFEREVLYPLAGVDPALSPVLARLRPLLDALELAIPGIIRDHEDGLTSNDEALVALQNEALVASPRALFAYAHEVGAYLAGYTLVRDSLQQHLPLDDAASWGRLRALLEDPASAEALLAAPAALSTR